MSWARAIRSAITRFGPSASRTVRQATGKLPSSPSYALMRIPAPGTGADIHREGRFPS